MIKAREGLKIWKSGSLVLDSHVGRRNVVLTNREQKRKQDIVTKGIMATIHEMHSHRPSTGAVLLIRGPHDLDETGEPLSPSMTVQEVDKVACELPIIAG